MAEAGLAERYPSLSDHLLPPSQGLAIDTKQAVDDTPVLIANIGTDALTQTDRLSLAATVAHRFHSSFVMTSCICVSTSHISFFFWQTLLSAQQLVSFLFQQLFELCETHLLWRQCLPNRWRRISCRCRKYCRGSYWRDARRPKIGRILARTRHWMRRERLIHFVVRVSFQ